MSKQLKDRTVTAIALLVLLGLAVYLRPIGLLVVIALVITAIFYEIWSILKAPKYTLRTVIIAAIIAIWVILNGPTWMLALVAAVALAMSFDLPFRIWLTIILVTLGAGGMGFILVSCFETALWLILVVIATDVGGYFSGRAIGGPKVWVAVSPNKTYAGLIGGWALVVLVTAFWNPLGVDGAAAFALAFCVSVFSQIGDFAQSAFKRYYHVKDSSNLLPGHGGVFDRFDGYCGVGVFISMLELLRLVTGVQLLCG